MNKWMAAWLIGLSCSLLTFAVADANEKGNAMMSGNGTQGNGMMNDEEMDAMHQNMGMSDEEREEYMMRLNACEKGGKSAKECEAQMDRQMDRDRDRDRDSQPGSMHKEDKTKAKSKEKANGKNMSAEEREEYMTKLKACEKSGRSANECQAKLDRQMNQDKVMKKDKDKY